MSISIISLVIAILAAVFTALQYLTARSRNKYDVELINAKYRTQFLLTLHELVNRLKEAIESFEKNKEIAKICKPDKEKTIAQLREHLSRLENIKQKMEADTKATNAIRVEQAKPDWAEIQKKFNLMFELVEDIRQRCEKCKS